ncbi:O-antigen ligase-related protein [Rhodopirellula maiorica SM1]|uniref:O-antigen ligase-related protein n=1 Tax=Rhodopirellula maiorica SM1 TaxID=1265738 RepID=M5RQA8_9BACT|nr:O-antigen ligase family protein [Rhodopirellula maiorica]EMI17572.1 O-antigen ligase-related protein [Rhodopirellula maiorica SM1]
MDANPSPDPLPTDQPAESPKIPVQPQRVSASTSLPRAASVRPDSSHRQSASDTIQPMRTTRSRSSRDSLQARQSNSPASLDRARIPLHLARALTLVALVYTCWRFGGTDAITIQHVSVLVLMAIVLTIISRKLLEPITTAAMLILVLGSSWLTFTAFQCVPIPSSLVSVVSPALLDETEQFADVAIAELTSFTDEHGPKLLDGETTNSNNPAAPTTSQRPLTLSVIPAATRKRLAVHAIALALFMLSTVLFPGRHSRKLLAWTLVFNAVFLGFWAILQRASGTTELLLGITREEVILPFATFIYKNAGAAAVIPGLGTAIGMLWVALMKHNDQSSGRRQPGKRSSTNSFSTSRGSRSQSFYNSSPLWTRPRIVVLVLLISLLTSALLISASRGALAATGLALLLVPLLIPLKLPVRSYAILASVLCLISLSAIIAGKLHPTLQSETGRMDRDSLSADGRWVHWQEAWRSAAEYFPVGSGAGTYGYAHLDQQVENTSEWFREAHQQFLETLVEYGLPGISIAVVSILLLLRHTYQLARRGASFDRRGWGIAGLIALLSVAIQSTVDFVILIPGVLFSHALLAGSISGVQQDVSQRQHHKKRGENPLTVTNKPAVLQSHHGDKSRLAFTGRLANATSFFCYPMTWFVPMLGIVFFAFVVLRQEAICDSVIEETDTLIVDYQPTVEEVSRNESLLDEAIRINPQRADLYHRRAVWRTVNFRLALVEHGKQQGHSIDWQATYPETFYHALHMLPSDASNEIVDQITSNPDLVNQLVNIASDLKQSIARNPLNPQVYLTSAFFAPLMKTEERRWLDILVPLSKSSRSIQFANGFLAYYQRDKETLIQQWNGALLLKDDFLEAIMMRAETILTPQEIAEQLVPSRRSEVALTILRRSKRVGASDDFLAALCDFGCKRIEQDSSLSDAEIYSLCAQLHETIDQHEISGNYWQRAVRSDGLNSDYRLRYTQTLIETGQLAEALKQASLGKASDPSNRQFGDLIDAIQKRLKDEIEQKIKASNL